LELDQGSQHPFKNTVAPKEAPGLFQGNDMYVYYISPHLVGNKKVSILNHPTKFLQNEANVDSHVEHNGANYTETGKI
jgi:hypothetical protein